MVSVQHETKRGLKTYFLDSLYGLFKIKRGTGTKAQSTNHDEGEFQRYDNLRHQTQSVLRHKAL